MFVERRTGNCNGAVWIIHRTGTRAAGLIRSDSPDASQLKEPERRTAHLEAPKSAVRSSRSKVPVTPGVDNWSNRVRKSVLFRCSSFLEMRLDNDEDSEQEHDQ